MPSPPQSQQTLTTTLTTFLTILTHQILYLRSLYPRSSFLSSRAYNHPVHQSRHPAVCAWVTDLIDALTPQLLRSTAANIAFVIYAVDSGEPMERFVVDLMEWPKVPVGEELTPFETRPLDERVSVNIDAQFRAVFSRLSAAAGRLKPIPRGTECSLSVVLEVKDNAEAPASSALQDRVWMAAEPEADSSAESDTRGPQRGNGKTTPVRRVDAGEIRMEIWAEETRGKLNLVEQTKPQEL